MKLLLGALLFGRVVKRRPLPCAREPGEVPPDQ